MRSLSNCFIAGMCLFAGVLFSAPRHDGAPLYQHIICVVPMIGSGTYLDPRRPMFAPGGAQEPLAAKTLGFADAPAISSLQSVPSDDGQFAIVQFVARDRGAFRQILAANPNIVTVFEPGKVAIAAVVTQLQKYKKNFTLDALKTGVQ
jgi:hypothetical protein